jgi:hypothetical protein
MREIFQVGDLEIDLAAYEVRRNGSTIKLEKMPM